MCPPLDRAGVLSHLAARSLGDDDETHFFPGHSKQWPTDLRRVDKPSDSERYHCWSKAIGSQITYGWENDELG